MALGGGWRNGGSFISRCEKGRRGGYYLIVVGFFFLCCLFVHYLFSLSLFPLIRSDECIEIVVSVM